MARFPVAAGAAAVAHLGSQASRIVALGRRMLAAPAILAERTVADATADRQGSEGGRSEGGRSLPPPVVPPAPKVAALTTDVPAPRPAVLPPPFVPRDAGRPAALSSYDRATAVYEIASHTVYLPDGTRLEAHSGLGPMLDDPRSVRERMRGATPPNVYEIRPLDKLFHGVRALRLNPVDDARMYGRDGILAHTYMLGPRGDSNGCVVFKDYKAFLQAYDSGAIKHLAVVTRLD